MSHKDVSRREFLRKGAKQGATLAGVAALTGSEALVGQVRTTPTDRHALVATLGDTLIPSTPDPTSRWLTLLEDDLRAHRIDLVFGLTLDSNCFLAEQIALQYAFRRDYLGIHDFRRGRFSHRLAGHARFVNALGDALNTDPASWIEAMASSLPLLSSPASTEKRRSTDAIPAQCSGSAAYLMSWSLRRG